MLALTSRSYRVQQIKPIVITTFMEEKTNIYVHPNNAKNS